MQKGSTKRASDVSEPALESVDPATISLMRFLLALSALVVLIADPPFVNRFALMTYAILLMYTVYSGIAYFFAIRSQEVLQPRFMHWLDIVWCLLIVTVSGGSDSVFYTFFLFAILVASFRWGFVEGIKITAVSASSFFVLCLILMPSTAETELQTLFLRPLYLAVLGYLIARWGGSEISHQRRLGLLREANRLPNPRFGVEQAINATLERMRDFFHGDACLAIIADASGGHALYLADTKKAEMAAQPLDPQTISELLALPPKCAIAYNKSPSWRYPGAVDWYVRFTKGAERVHVDRALAAHIANFLEAKAFISVPLYRRSVSLGRIYITASTGIFGASDVVFIQQLCAQMMPVIENISLLDQIATDAAVHERRKISRDLHDSTIQPYVGLKIGLEALLRKVPVGSNLGADVEELCRMTNDGIAELRRYVGGLKNQEDAHSKILFQAVTRQAEKYKEFFGIDVAVNANPDLRINDRLAAELVHIVSEGLSNIRRHTKSRSATINLRREDNNLLAQIINHGSPYEPFKPFTPRSLSERAAHLGGRVEIMQWGEGSTAVTVEIPL